MINSHSWAAEETACSNEVCEPCPASLYLFGFALGCAGKQFSLGVLLVLQAHFHPSTQESGMFIGVRSLQLNQ